MLEKLPKKVRIVEVGPRDGLQNEKKIVSTEDKANFIEKLLFAGVKNIEVTSFVRGEKIPQMKDGGELWQKVKKKTKKGVSLLALVPNIKGLKEAIAVGVEEIAVFTATSDTFNQKNINTDIEGSMKRLEEVVQKALDEKLKIRAYISTVFSCPYEGKTSLEKLIELCRRLFSLGAFEISLGDTIGSATPKEVLEVIEKVEKYFPLGQFSMHFHDTRGMALANILTCLEAGIVNFDSSAAGLGGCPYANGASGNVATEELVYLFDSLGIETGIDQEKLMEASSFILGKLRKKSLSKYLQFSEKRLT